MPLPRACGAKRFTLSIGPRFRGLNHGACGRLIARALRASTWRWWLRTIRAKPGLAQLTGSFERIWYGGRAAGESDYRHAEELATALIAGTAVGLAMLSPAAQGGAA